MPIEAPDLPGRKGRGLPVAHNAIALGNAKNWTGPKNCYIIRFRKYLQFGMDFASAERIGNRSGFTVLSAELKVNVMNRRSLLQGLGSALAAGCLDYDPALARAPRAVRPGTNPNRIPDEAAFFALIDLDLPALAAVKEAVGRSDWPTAKREWARHLAVRTTPNWLWSLRDKAKIISVETAQFGGLARFQPAADKVLARDFDTQGIRKTLDHDINWLQGANEWTNVLNRHQYFVEMGKAYWATGDPKYAVDFVYLLNRWITKNPVLPNAVKSGHVFGTAWRTLEAGIRQESWCDAFQLFADAPEFDDDTKYRMTRSFAEHASYLSQGQDRYRGGNWQVTECQGLAVIGIMFPEFRRAAAWREVAFHYLVQHMNQDVEPDGMHWEMTPGYHQIVAADYTTVSILCRRNGYKIPGLLDRHEKMYDAILSLTRPDRKTPALGDAHDGDVRQFLAEGALLYNRPDMRYVAGEVSPEGWLWKHGADAFERYKTLPSSPPKAASTLLPNAKYVSMRNGWSPQDTLVLLDCAPYHGGHNHRDALQVILFAGGRSLLLDPGIAAYDSELSKTYLRTANAHNVLVVDGKDQPHTDAELLQAQFGDQADVSAGRFAQNGIVHQRTVLFVKPAYAVVVDHVTGDGSPHELTRLFHLPEGATRPDGTGVRTVFPTGANIRVLAADDTAAGTRLEMRDGFIPGPRNQPITTPVAAFVNNGSLPAVLCTVLSPFRDETHLPTVVRLPSTDPGVVRLRITLPGGVIDEIAVAGAPMTLTVAGKTGTGRALCVRGKGGASVVLTPVAA
jgi:hypothetical protein